MMLPTSLEAIIGRLVWSEPSKQLRVRDEDFRNAYTAGWNAAVASVAQSLGFDHPALPQWHERCIAADRIPRPDLSALTRKAS